MVSTGNEKIRDSVKGITEGGGGGPDRTNVGSSRVKGGK